MKGELAKAGEYVDNVVQGPLLEKYWPDLENFVFSPPYDYWGALDSDLAPGGAIRKKITIIPENVTFNGTVDSFFLLSSHRTRYLCWGRFGRRFFGTISTLCQV